ncbi:MAG: hypothetical protein EPO42_13315 [Gallionellaceae bacterium]|nr:MAG: hypothetical protein EPO42_13315 [Gallionellaceae bacterium]
MQNLPEAGKTYISQTDQSKIYVESVDLIEADELGDAGFCVTGCDPKDKGDMGAVGYEFMNDEWEAHRFTLMQSE